MVHKYIHINIILYTNIIDTFGLMRGDINTMCDWITFSFVNSWVIHFTDRHRLIRLHTHVHVHFFI